MVDYMFELEQFEKTRKGLLSPVKQTKSDSSYSFRDESEKKMTAIELRSDEKWQD
jgi:hypothetical protein